MKKTSILLLATVMLLSLVACGDKNNKENDDTTGVDQQVEQNVENNEKEDVSQQEDKKSNWPDNEFTKLIPEPDFAFIAANVSGNTFKANYSGATTQQVRDYAAQVKNAGFSLNEQVKDENLYGMETYQYTASNAEGYTVDIYCGNESISITITK